MQSSTVRAWTAALVCAVAADGFALSPRRVGRARRIRRSCDDGFEEAGAPGGALASDAAHPSISVTMITRCRPRFLREALRSVARQDYPLERVEVLVVDDSPEDDGPSLLEFLRDSPLTVRYVRPSDVDARCRLGRKRNAAVRRARGDLVFVWDDDDYFGPKRLATQAEALADGGAVLLGEDEPLTFFYYDAADGAFRSTSSCSFAQPCSMAYERKLWGTEATYPDDLDAFEDIDFFERLLFAGVRVTTAHVPWVRTRHAHNVVQDAQGDGEESVVDADVVARRCDLPDSTVAFLLGLPREAS